VEMKAIESVIQLRNVAPHKIKNMVPKATWVLLEKYEIRPSSDEIRASREST
jgi:coenzyme F420 hydrogenase subunit beta